MPRLMKLPRLPLTWGTHHRLGAAPEIRGDAWAPQKARLPMYNPHVRGGYYAHPSSPKGRFASV